MFIWFQMVIWIFNRYTAQTRNTCVEVDAQSYEDPRFTFYPSFSFKTWTTVKESKLSEPIFAGYGLLHFPFLPGNGPEPSTCYKIKDSKREILLGMLYTTETNTKPSEINYISQFRIVISFAAVFINKSLPAIASLSIKEIIRSAFHV